MMGAMEPVVPEDSVVTMEDVFRDLHLKGQQASMASTGATELEGVELEETWPSKSPWTKVKRRRRKPRRPFQRSILLPLWWQGLHLLLMSLPHKGLCRHPPVIMGNCCLPGFQTSMGAPIPSQLNYENHPFFAELFPLPSDMEPFNNRILSVDGNKFEAWTILWC